MDVIVLIFISVVRFLEKSKFDELESIIKSSNMGENVYMIDISFLDFSRKLLKL